MFSFKIYYLFKDKIRRLKLYDILAIFICSIIMPSLLRFIPLADHLLQPILILYFLGAASSRILALPILLMTSSSIAQFTNLLYLMYYIDLCVLIRCNKTGNMFFLFYGSIFSGIF